MESSAQHATGHWHPFVDASNDPTGTATLRRKFMRASDKRWRAACRLVMEAVGNGDLLGLGQPNLNSVALRARHGGMAGADPVTGFRHWLDNLLRDVVVGHDGSWMAPFVSSAEELAAKRARDVGVSVPPPSMPATLPHRALVLSELHALATLGVQRGTRAAASALASRQRPQAAARRIAAALREAMARSRLMADFAVAKTHAAVLLEHFRAAGITHVGVDSSACKPKRYGVKTSRGVKLRMRDRDPPWFKPDIGKENQALLIGELRKALPDLPPQARKLGSDLILASTGSRGISIKQAGLVGKLIRQSGGEVPELEPIGKAEEAEPAAGAPDLSELIGKAEKAKAKLEELDVVNVLTAGDDDVCIVAPALIRTFGGDRPIEQVKIGDLVLTRLGWRRVLGTSERKFHGKLVRIISENSPSLICTANHPIWTERRAFVRADQVNCIDVLQGFDNKRVNVLRIDDVSLADVADNPAKRFKRAVAAFLPFRLAMPIKPVHFKSKMVCHDEVDRPSLDLHLGDERHSETFERLTDDRLDAGLAFESPIAAERAEAASRHAGWNAAELLSALMTRNDVRRPAAFFRAVRANYTAGNVAMTLLEYFSAAWTSFFGVAKVLLFARPRAKVIAVGDGAVGNRELLIASGAGFGDGIRAAFVEARKRAKLSSYRDVIKTTAASCADKLAWKMLTFRRHAVVYNLAVDQCQEYYANGVLVHNCVVCEDISEEGPYDINEAQELIPAHPNCRCTFVPADDARFSQTEFGGGEIPEEEEEPVEPGVAAETLLSQFGAGARKAEEVGLGAVQAAFEEPEEAEALVPEVEAPELPAGVAAAAELGEPEEGEEEGLGAGGVVAAVLGLGAAAAGAAGLLGGKRRREEPEEEPGESPMPEIKEPVDYPEEFAGHTAAEYVAYVNRWLDWAIENGWAEDMVGERWDDEEALRDKVGMTPEQEEALSERVDEVASLVEK